MLAPSLLAGRGLGGGVPMPWQSQPELWEKLKPLARQMRCEPFADLFRQWSASKPVAVRYGWADFPVVNLWNKEGLPASPFRTDDFPMIKAPKKVIAAK